MTGGAYKPGVSIPRDLKERLNVWLTKNHRELGRTVSGVLEWFLESDAFVQDYVLSKPSQQMAAMQAQALRKMADDLEKQASSRTAPLDAMLKIVRTAAKPHRGEPK